LALGACNSDSQPAASESENARPEIGQDLIEQTIPDTMQGRWGMVPADCTSTKGDAKGLLVIDATSLRFYESVGTLTSVSERSANSIRGQFAFTGEGMEWTREETLSLEGATLTRTENGGDLPGPLQYRRCA